MRLFWTGRAGIIRAAFLFVFSITAILGATALVHPESPMPIAWNPLRPLDPAASVTPITRWKLTRTLRNADSCIVALQKVASFQATGEKTHENTQCGIENAVVVDRIGTAQLRPLETDCQTALRTAMWYHHSLKPLADQLLGRDIARIHHLGSFNCRPIRTTMGNGNRMSTHATGMAIDIAGFDLNDGTKLRLIDDWSSQSPRAEFLRQVRDEACDWYQTTLSPDFNALHSDHFHLQSQGWGTCR